MEIFQEKSMDPTDIIKHVWWLSFTNRWPKLLRNRLIFYWKNWWLFTPNNFLPPMPTDSLIGRHRWVSSFGVKRACVPSNDFQGLKKIGWLCQTKKIGRFFHRFFSKLLVSFVGEKRFTHRQKYKNRWVLILLSISKNIYWCPNHEI